MEKIDNWFIGLLSDYHPPELARFFGNIGLKFKVFSDPVSYNEKTNVLTTKSGSKYILGEPKDDYLKMFPDARERLVKNLKKE